MGEISHEAAGIVALCDATAESALCNQTVATVVVSVLSNGSTVCQFASCSIWAAQGMLVTAGGMLMAQHFQGPGSGPPSGPSIPGPLPGPWSGEEEARK